jgi:hypothetical protein
MPEWVNGTTFVFEKNEDNVGCAWWHAEECVAAIRIAPDLTDEQVEETVIHELLHLVLEGHMAIDGEYDEGYERGLNRIARTLRLAYEAI